MTSSSHGAAALLALLCSACGSEVAPQVADDAPAIANKAKPQSAAARAPAAFLVEEKGPLLEFTFGWSAEAAAVPELAARFEKRMTEWKTELLNGAREDKAFRDEKGYPFNGYTGSTLWTTAGQSTRLLSLVGAIESYTGGAHGNHGSTGLLWDRSARRELMFTDLFPTPASRDALLNERWCALLDEQRAKRRGEPVGTDGPFDSCPKLDEVSIAPTDKDGDGMFERLALIADPYVAGPWAEGDYEVELTVTQDFIAALKPEFRSSFEAQPQ